MREGLTYRVIISFSTRRSDASCSLARNCIALEESLTLTAKYKVDSSLDVMRVSNITITSYLLGRY
jgi:hypothetical protein